MAPRRVLRPAVCCGTRLIDRPRWQAAKRGRGAFRAAVRRGSLLEAGDKREKLIWVGQAPWLVGPGVADDSLEIDHER